MRLHELLLQRTPTPVVALGRAIARARLAGAAAGIAELLAIEGRARLESYPFLWAALGDLAIRAGEPARARLWLESGRATARNDAERGVFRRRLAECEASASA